MGKERQKRGGEEKSMGTRAPKPSVDPNARKREKGALKMKRGGG